MVCLLPTKCWNLGKERKPLHHVNYNDSDVTTSNNQTKAKEKGYDQVFVVSDLLSARAFDVKKQLCNGSAL